MNVQFNGGTEKYRISVSTDEISWTFVTGGQLTQITAASMTSQNFSMPWETVTITEISARYIRFHVDSTFGIYGGLSEFQVFKCAELNSRPMSAHSNTPPFLIISRRCSIASKCDCRCIPNRRRYQWPKRKYNFHWKSSTWYFKNSKQKL